MNNLLSPAQFRIYAALPSTITDTLLAQLIRQETGAMTVELGFKIAQAENLEIIWTFLTGGQDLYLPCPPLSITGIVEGVSARTVAPTEYITKDVILAKIMSGAGSLSNYFDTVISPYGAVWLPPVVVTFKPSEEYLDLVQEVLIELVLVRLAKLGRLNSIQSYLGISSYKMGEMEVKYAMTSNTDIEATRRSAYKRLYRNRRIG